ncbi:sorbitol operon transcription regulator [Liquorilactobacillus sucicola DSM 21376 = JCM 15457]|uniref:PTS sugar transporter subunit IIA n=1 Tax=Liquorilactobacillus sucicola TaxID=519050 RepID=UPI0004321068|nr:PTS sugar transporter subunit IIA [Liquorilactobacillus sucicola]GAJ26573.1 sorbitol operon transcription regulator [Liquorilactobacillus sucicola DSM 21376 = JCM 15457]
MIQAKIKSGSLSADFLKSWEKRERQGSNVFENGIAIPHVVDNSDNERILLNIGVFDTDVKYQDRKVRIVFLIGIPQKLNHQLNKVLTQVYDLVFAVANNRNIYNNILDYDQQRALTQITEGI